MANNFILGCSTGTFPRRLNLPASRPPPYALQQFGCEIDNGCSHQYQSRHKDRNAADRLSCKSFNVPPLPLCDSMSCRQWCRSSRITRKSDYDFGGSRSAIRIAASKRHKLNDVPPDSRNRLARVESWYVELGNQRSHVSGWNSATPH